MARRSKNILPPISEAEFQQQVVQLATICGFESFHTYDSRKSDEGFPDWVFVNP